MAGVIILAAGNGSRADLGYNKMLFQVEGVPLYKIVVDKFKRFGFKEIVLVINERDYDKIQTDCLLVIGGATRAESVYRGLQMISEDQVLIHDGARPFITQNVIQSAIDALVKDDAVVVGKKITDTIKDLSNGMRTVDRESLIAVETPQGGETSLLKECYKKGLDEGFIGTDDMSYVEKYSDEHIAVVLHDDLNIKITTASDLEYANYLFMKGSI